MKIVVDSDEYKCWHEVGHATVCLHLGGDVEFIEFLEVGDSRGYARARCVHEPDTETERSVASAGFAAEFYLLNRRYAKMRPGDKRDFNWVPFHNATHDREAFWERKLGEGEEFTKSENEKFMFHALSMIPILDRYFSQMQVLVGELLGERRVEGRRVRELLGFPIPR